jgi:RimJ/RimL family protein N-acetyltransferase
VIYGLERRVYERTHRLFKELDHQVTALAVVEGSCPGSIWVDSITQPRTAIMTSPEGHFLVGHKDNTAVDQALNQLIVDTLLSKDADSQHLERIVLVCHPEEWEEQFDVVLAGIISSPERRWHYLFERPLVDWRNQLPRGLAIEHIDQALLDRPGLCIPEHLKRWMKHNWGSVESFLRQGVGFCAVQRQKIVSWCLTDCRSGSACEIGIHTHQGYRRRGLATLTVAATVEECLHQGLTTVGWHCHETNLGSRGVAERVGFVKERVYMSYTCLADQSELKMSTRGAAPDSTCCGLNQNRKI